MKIWNAAEYRQMQCALSAGVLPYIHGHWIYATEDSAEVKN